MFWLLYLLGSSSEERVYTHACGCAWMHVPILVSQIFLQILMRSRQLYLHNLLHLWISNPLRDMEKHILKWEMENEIIRKWGRVSSVILWIALRSRAHNFQSLRTPLPAYSQVDESLATDLVELGFYPSLPCQLLAQVTFHWCRLQNLLILLESWMWMWEKMYSKI